MTAPNPEINAAERKVTDSASDVAYATRVSGDSFDRYQVLADGTTKVGDGTSSPSPSGTSLPSGFTATGDGSDDRTLTIQAKVGQTSPVIVVLDEDGNPRGSISPTGEFVIYDATGNVVLLVSPSDISLMAAAQTGQTEAILRLADDLGDPLFEVGPTGEVLAVGIPTADPAVAGALWNDSGTLKVSAG